MKKVDFQIIVKFFFFLLSIILLASFGHVQLLKHKELWSDLVFSGLMKAYIFNGVVTLAIFSSLMFLKKKHMASLGFFFLGGSLLKIILFFILFRPAYSEDGVISKLEFSEFFIPYGVCLFFEVFFLVKVLMKE